MSYFSSYNGKTVDEMTQRELLDYADTLIFNGRDIYVNKDPYAYNELVSESKNVLNAINNRLTLHIENNYLDEEYYHWINTRNSLLRFILISKTYKDKEFEIYNKIVSNENITELLSPLNDDTEEWLLEEYDKAEAFTNFAINKFPFTKEEDQIRWKDWYNYYRSIVDKVHFETNCMNYDLELILLHRNYKLYKEENNGLMNFYVFSIDGHKKWEQLLNISEDTPNKLEPIFSEQIIKVSSGQSDQKLNNLDFFCICSNFIIRRDGTWPSVKKYIESAAEAIFSDFGKLKVIVFDNGYAEYQHQGEITINDRHFPFWVDQMETPLNYKSKMRFLKLYIWTDSLAIGDSLRDPFRWAFPYGTFDDLTAYVFERLSSIRITQKGNESNPSKPVLLLSILESIQKGLITSHKVTPTKALRDVFFINWDRYASRCMAYKPNFEDTFYRLQAENFWTLIDINEHPYTDKLQTKQISEECFYNSFKYAIIDEFIFLVMSNKRLAEVVKDILRRMLDNEHLKYEQCLDDILKKIKINRNQTELSVVIPKIKFGDGDLPIPEGILEIPPYAYKGRTDIVNLVIPNGVKRIGNLAFCECSNLKTIKFPSTLTHIGNAAFKACHKLEEVVLPSKTYEIGISAFALCDSIKKVELPLSLKNIDARAFKGCTSLQSIHFQKKVNGTGTQAFENCTSLNIIEIDEGVKQIDSYSFMGCSNLQKVLIPESVHWVGEKPFGDCTKLERISFAIGNDICYLNPYRGIPNLKIIDIPRDCTFISTPFVLSQIQPQIINIEVGNETYVNINGALYNKKKKCLVYCRKDVTKFVVEKGTKVLGTYCFAGCGALQDLYLPSSINRIEDNVIVKCKNLSNIFVPNDILKKMLERLFPKINVIIDSNLE